MKLKLSIIAIICLCLSGCDKTDAVYQNKVFEDICSLTNANNSPFCIVLSDSTQILSREYLTYSI
ncbi:MAG: hypothetical protein LBG80_08895 [Bacteroidales bacterium]|nr:hypothetical protein [Bacteroidales bacterium]